VASGSQSLAAFTPKAEQIGLRFAAFHSVLFGAEVHDVVDPALIGQGADGYQAKLTIPRVDRADDQSICIRKRPAARVSHVRNDDDAAESLVRAETEALGCSLIGSPFDYLAAF
jgi:predicted trehalose synthase